MNAVGVFFFIEPLIYYKIRVAETGHARHVLKTLLYTQIIGILKQQFFHQNHPCSNQLASRESAMVT